MNVDAKSMNVDAKSVNIDGKSVNVDALWRKSTVKARSATPKARHFDVKKPLPLKKLIAAVYEFRILYVCAAAFINYSIIRNSKLFLLFQK